MRRPRPPGQGHGPGFRLRLERGYESGRGYSGRTCR
jgi:hypothetical protein